MCGYGVVGDIRSVPQRTTVLGHTFAFGSIAWGQTLPQDVTGLTAIMR
jgi:hypothetical protein